MLRSGFDGMDAIHLRNGTEVVDMIAASGRCQTVINGHIHRIIVSSYRGVTHAMIKSPCHQMPMVLGAGPQASQSQNRAAMGFYFWIRSRLCCIMWMLTCPNAQSHSMASLRYKSRKAA